MLFNSYQFVVFFVLVLLVHRRLRSQGSRLWLLLIASCVFYAAWSAWFLLLLLSSVVVDFLVGHALVRWPARARTILAGSLAFNLGGLAVFKYADFIALNLGRLAQGFGIAWYPRPPGLPLPLGISFYTFMTLSYTIDVYRRVCLPERSLLRYSTFLLFFPHLVSGPILRAREFLPQLANPDPRQLRPYFGINRIALGFIKKILLADLLAYLIRPVFQDPAAYDGAANLLATYLCSFQIYFDFSGYCDIAIGTAALLGYHLPENFDSPLLSTNFLDLWRRWHISLSRWLRDYVYIPLGGNRWGTPRTSLNLLSTMLIGGLWHGASWNFVIWGAVHGLLLVASRVVRADTAAQSTRRVLTLPSLLVFNLFSLSWVAFSSPTLAKAWTMLTRIAALPASGPLRTIGALAFVPASLFCYSLATRARRRWENTEPQRVRDSLAYGLAMGLGVVVLALFGARQSEFVYFRF